MQASDNIPRWWLGRNEFVFALAGLLFCSVVVVLVVADGGAVVGSLELAQILALAVTGGAATLACGLIWRSTGVARRLGRKRLEEMA